MIEKLQIDPLMEMVKSAEILGLPTQLGNTVRLAIHKARQKHADVLRNMDGGGI